MKWVKIIILFLYIFVSGNLLKAQNIDSLETDLEVEKYINEFRFPTGNPPFFGTFLIYQKNQTVFPFYASLTAIEKIQSWYKVDLNEDGLTDLIVNGYVKQNSQDKDGTVASYAIIQTGTEYPEFLETNKPNQNGFAKPIKYNGKTLILHCFYSYDLDLKKSEEDTPQSKGVYVDTLNYWLNHIVEYNPNPQDLSIDSLIIPSLKVTNSRLAYKTISLFGTKRIVERGILSQSQWDTLQIILNYISIPKLDTRYHPANGLMLAHEGTCYFFFYYGKGKSKRVYDDDCTGTRGLILLTEYLQSLESKVKFSLF